MRRRRLQRRALVLLVVAGLIGALALLGRDDGTDVATTPSTTTTTQPELPQGEAIKGDTPCPAADGSSPRTTKFEKAPPMCIDPAKTYSALVSTDVGDFTIELDPAKAPKTVNNFVVLARYHAYDGVPFHRVIPDFVVQGGDIRYGKGMGDAGYKFEDELPKPEDYAEGSVAMANSGPNTNGSQFFVVTSATGASQLTAAKGGKASYSLFGKVTSGMDVVKKIEADGGAPGSFDGKPKVVHTITRVTITES